MKRRLALQRSILASLGAVIISFAFVHTLSAEEEKTFLEPVLVTSAGRSFDVITVVVLCQKAGIEIKCPERGEDGKAAQVSDLEGCKSLILTPRVALKGFFIDPYDIEAEFERVAALIKAAKEQNIIIAVGQIERHNPVVRFTKDMLDNKSFGDLISLASRRVSSFPARIKDVGVILDLGIHDIDVMRYLVGAKISSVYSLAGITQKEENTKFEDHANILVEFELGNGETEISGFINFSKQKEVEQ